MSESNIANAKKGEAMIYACGGAPINIMANLGSIQLNPDLLANIEVVQLDTSFSNVTARSSNVENYLLPQLANVDGGGKNQDENKALIEEHVKPVLKKHPPRDINIVISTGSGGTGSVFATRLANELKARGEIVIVLLIGTTGSRIEANNSIKTIKNYQKISKARNAPTIMSYLQNSPDLPRVDVNRHMLSTISYIAMLFSRRNKGLDLMDLRNWAYFTRPEITKGGLPAQVYSLTILLRDLTEEGEEKFVSELNSLGNILSVATLAQHGTNPELPTEFMPEYHAEGFLPELKDSAMLEGKTINFIISDGLVESFSQDLLSFAQREKPVVARSSLMEAADIESDEF
jgi:hypothetical protein